MTYHPQPLVTSEVELPKELMDLTERLAENTHDIWARQRIAEGWKFGQKRNDNSKEHPDLVPYDKLPDAEKEYDRLTAMETLKAIVLLGYKIEKVVKL
jgi:hypothetical protein